MKLCTSSWSKFCGLMFSRKKDLCFVFGKEKIISIHNCFVFFPINLIYLNKDKKVVEIKNNLKPFQFYTPKKKAMFVLELPNKHDFKLHQYVPFE